VEIAETCGLGSEHLFWKLLQQLTDGPPFERSIGDATLMVIAVTEQPSFANRATGQGCGEQVG